jgi:hypothetical protein
MNTYRLRFISGPQEALRSGREQYVTASSPAEALATRCNWPVQHNMEQTCAWAKNPGTCLYYVETWEAQYCPSGLSGDNDNRNHV